MYSISSDRRTSTMKSDPQCSVVITSTSGGVPVSARGFCIGAPRRGAGFGPAPAEGGAGTASVAAPAAAAPFRNLRRVGENFEDLLISSLRFTFLLACGQIV